MTQTNNLTKHPIFTALLVKRMLVGASIGLALISFFLFSTGESNPEWGKLWMIKPLLIVPLAGATGAAFFHLMDPFRYKGGWQKIIATALALIVFIIGLWLGSVLGLNGTYWN